MISVPLYAAIMPDVHAATACHLPPGRLHAQSAAARSLHRQRTDTSRVPMRRLTCTRFNPFFNITTPHCVVPATVQRSGTLHRSDKTGSATDHNRRLFVEESFASVAGRLYRD